MGVKGHADEGMVRDGRVRELDRIGNNAAEVADFGRRVVDFLVIDARRNFAGVCGRWYPVILELHRFFMAISRAVVNHDDGAGTAPDPLVWSAGALPKRSRVGGEERGLAILPGPPSLWRSEWIRALFTEVTDDDDVSAWPYSVSLLVKFVAFLGILHWPVAGDDLGRGGMSYVEMLILFELWAGDRLVLEKDVAKYRRLGRQISVSAVSFGLGTDIWRSCRFIGALFRWLCALPGGIGRFMPSSVGAPITEG